MIWEGWPTGEAASWFASAYDTLFPPGRHRTWELDHVLARWSVSGVERVTDLGAGNGRSALLFADAGLEVIAVERDPAFVAILREHLAGDWRHVSRRVDVRCGDIPAYRPADPVMQAFSNAVINLTDDGRDRFFTNLRALLGPGGELAVLLMDLEEGTLSQRRWSIPPLCSEREGRRVGLDLQISIDPAARTRLERWVIEMEAGGASERTEIIIQYTFESPEDLRWRIARAGLEMVELVTSPVKVPGRHDFIAWIKRP